MVRAAARDVVEVIDRIVVPLNGSEFSERAFRPAVAVARRVGATVHLVSATGDGPIGEALSYLEERAGLAGAAVTVHAERGNPAEVICRAAEGEGTLVFMSCRGRGLGALLGAHTAEHVLAEIGCPVVLVGPRCHVSLVEGERSRVVASIDDRVDSEAVVTPAAMLAGALEAELGFVEVVPPEETVEIDAVPTFDTPTEQGRLRVAEMVRRAEALGVRATGDVLYGAEVSESLVHHVNRVMASFLAMAVHVHTGVERLTSEGVALKTVARAPCPVLAVRAG